jgi:hypothetical protein
MHWVPLVCCPSSPRVQASHNRCSFSWAFKLSPFHSHSNSWLTVLSLTSLCGLRCTHLTLLELCLTCSTFGYLWGLIRNMPLASLYILEVDHQEPLIPLIVCSLYHSVSPAASLSLSWSTLILVTCFDVSHSSAQSDKLHQHQLRQTAVDSEHTT